MRRNASTRNGMVRLLAVLIGAGGLTACQLLGPGCELVERPGVLVTVVDSITGELIEDEGVTVVVTDGEYVDTATHLPRSRYSAAYEREGVYRVEVTAPGYMAWVREGVVVEGGECGVIPTEIEARMVREEAAEGTPVPPPPAG